MPSPRKAPDWLHPPQVFLVWLYIQYSEQIPVFLQGGGGSSTQLSVKFGSNQVVPVRLGIDIPDRLRATEEIPAGTETVHGSARADNQVRHVCTDDSAHSGGLCIHQYNLLFIVPGI